MSLLVGALMTPDPVTLGERDSVADLVDLMDKHHFRHVPIVDSDGNLVGLVSHRDVVKSTLGAIAELPMTQQHEYLETVLLDRIMVKGVATVEASVELQEAGETMLENKYGCLPVVEGNRLVGILTEADFVRHVVEKLDYET